MHLVQLPAAGCGGTLPHGIHLGRKIGDHPFRHIEVAQHIGLEQPDNLPGILPFLAVRNKPPAPNVMTTPRITARELSRNDFQPSLSNSFIWRGGTILTVPGTFQNRRSALAKPGRHFTIPFFFTYFLHHGFQVGIGLRPDGRPAGSDRTARRLDPPRLQTQHPAGRHGFGKDLHGGQRHRATQPPDAGPEPQQDPRGAALRRVPQLLPRKRRRVLRLLLRLLPAGGLPPRRRTPTSRKTSRSTPRSRRCASARSPRCCRAAAT